jgi:hypothetical protein
MQRQGPAHTCGQSEVSYHYCSDQDQAHHAEARSSSYMWAVRGKLSLLFRSGSNTQEARSSSYMWAVRDKLSLLFRSGSSTTYRGKVQLLHVCSQHYCPDQDQVHHAEARSSSYMWAVRGKLSLLFRSGSSTPCRGKVQLIHVGSQR